jgi:hypothetical protein
VRRARDRNDSDGHVEPEDGLPVPALDNSAADERAERDAEAGDAAPDADGQRAESVLHRSDQQGQRERHDRGGAEALKRAADDEHPRLVAEGGEDRGNREDDDADDEDGATAEAVAESRRHEDEAGEAEREGVDEPLQLLDRRAEVEADRGQRVGHHQVVEGGHEHGQGGGDDRQPDGHPTGERGGGRGLERCCHEESLEVIE